MSSGNGGKAFHQPLNGETVSRCISPSSTTITSTAMPGLEPDILYIVEISQEIFMNC